MPEPGERHEPELQSVQEGQEVFDRDRFEEVNRAISDLESYEPEVPEHVNVEFIMANAHIFALALRDESSAFSAVYGLERLAGHYDHAGEYDNDVVKFALSEICNLQTDIEQAAQKRLGLPEQHVLRLYNELVKNGNDGQKMVGADCLSQHLPAIKEGLAEPKMWGAYLQYAEGIIKFGRQEDQQRVSEIVISMVDECKEKEQFAPIVRLMMKSSDPALILKAEEIVEDELIAADLPYQELLGDWERSTEPGERAEALCQNIKAIKEIEKKNKGGCKFLHEEFGISDFGRYPPEILLKQIEEFESKKNPYGVIIFPRGDWNGAFYQDTTILRDLYKQLGGEFSLRVAECEDRLDVASVLMRCNKRYNPPDGSGHKISLLILGGHGSQNHINFGGYGKKSDKKYFITTKYLMGGRAQRAGQFFVDNPTIILSSCSTGAEGGIGQELSKRFGAKVIAPKEPTSMAEIHASKNRGQNEFRFNATYAARDSKKLYKSGEPSEK